MVVVAVVGVGVGEQVVEEEAVRARVVPTWGPLGT